MQIVFELSVRVDVWLAAHGRVDTPRPLACPSCGHARVLFDGWYARHTRRGRVAIHRVRCANGGCAQRGHSLLPDVLVRGRVDLASVIGWGLEAKAAGVADRRIAARVWTASTQPASSPHASTPTTPTSSRAGTPTPTAAGPTPWPSPPWPRRQSGRSCSSRGTACHRRRSPRSERRNLTP